MNAIYFLMLSTGLLMLEPDALSEQKPNNYHLPGNPENAWAEVGKTHELLRAPSDWQNRKPSEQEIAIFQKQLIQSAFLLADKAREFITRFPTNENVQDARITVVDALRHAVAAGDLSAEQQITAFVEDVLAHKTISENDRAVVLCYAGNTSFMKKVGMRLFTEGRQNFREGFEDADLESTRTALKQFPTNSFIFTLLVAVAERSKYERQQELAAEILNAPGAPAAVKTLAAHILKGTRPYEIGKPLDIRFTALDGREVDLANFRGKVVLVEFWSTTCGPCIVGMPKVKAVYEKFHPLGFEVVGISIDDNENALRRFLKEKDLPWPQHFDGKGWANKFTSQFGIFSIPTMWLFDKLGNLRVTRCGSDRLAQAVKELLDEPAPSDLR